jgi:hypothetical protein
MATIGRFRSVSKRFVFEMTLRFPSSAKKDDFDDLTIKKCMLAGMPHGISRLRLSLILIPPMASYLGLFALSLLKGDGMYDSIGANWYKIAYLLSECGCAVTIDVTRLQPYSSSHLSSITNGPTRVMQLSPSPSGLLHDSFWED